MTWAHGTTAASFMILPRTGFFLDSTGNLLCRRIAPICGELIGGGLRWRGISYSCVSGTGPTNFERSIQYAQRKYGADFRGHTLRLSSVIEGIQSLDPEKRLKAETITELAITILRVRQTDEHQYQQESAEKIRSITPAIEASLRKQRLAIGLIHSLTDIEFCGAKVEHLIKIMKERFSEDVLNRAGWSEEKATKRFLSLESGKMQQMISLPDFRVVCASGKITPDVVSLFWVLLLAKYFEPKFFAEELLPQIQSIYRDSVHGMGVLESIFRGAVSPDSPPVRLSQEEISQIEPFSQIPVIFASTLNLQAHVNKSIFPDVQFNQIEQISPDEVPLDGPLRLGRELNIVMTDPVHVPDVRAFILKHRIQGIALFSFHTRQNPLRPEEPSLRYRRESLEELMPQRPLALPPLASPANTSAPAAAAEAAPAADSKREETFSSLRAVRERLFPPAAPEAAPAARGQKRQGQPDLKEPENKRPRPVSEREETLSSLRAIREMFLKDGQKSEAEKISRQIKALEDSSAADKSMRPADRKPQPVSEQEEHLSNLYAIHKVLLEEGEAAEARKIAEQIKALEDSSAADKPMRPADRKPQPVSKQEENLSSLYAIHEMLLKDGQAAEARKIAEQIEALVNH